MSKQTIAFIGGGNMATAIVGGLINDGRPEDTIWIADPNQTQLEAIAARWPGVHATRDNDEVIAHAGLVVLAVKPQALQGVATGLRDAVQAHRPLIVSIAAGVREADIDRWLGGGLAIVRCMPNTPALVGSGATALHANARVEEAQRSLAERILRAVGMTLWLEEESQLDAVTAVSGSGPAYFFYVMEAMEAAGVKLGLSHEAARLLVLETAFGAAKLGLESPEDAASLRRRVTSKGGTTERALDIMGEGGLADLIERALSGAAERARELANELGADET